MKSSTFELGLREKLTFWSQRSRYNHSINTTLTVHVVCSDDRIRRALISYPESSGSLVSGLVARRDSGEMEFFPLKSGDPVVVRMLSFIKTEVNVSREVGKLDESLDGNLQ